MAKKYIILFTMLLLVLSSCATPTPVTIIQTQVVEKPVVQTQIVEVPGTPQIVVVTPTAAPVKEEPIILTFAGWIAMEESGKVPWQKMVDGFQAKYPNIKIEYVGYPWANQLDQLVMMVASGNAPDVAQIDINSNALFEMGALEPLDDKFPAARVADLYDAAKEGGMYKGQLLAWPWVIGNIGLVYNVDLLKKAGYDKPPATLDELAKAAQKVDGLGPDIYGLGMSVTRSGWTSYFFLPFLWSYNADILDKDGNIIVNSPEAVKAVDYYKGLVKSGAIPTGSDIYDFRALFAKDKLGFYWDAPASRGILEQTSGIGTDFRSHYACMPVPVGPSGKAESTLWGHWLTVFKTSKNKDAAYKFIDYLTSDPDIIKMYHDTMGMIPPSKTLLAGPDYQDAFTKCFIDGTATSRSVPSTVQNSPQFMKALDAFSIGLEEVVLKDRPTKAALDDVAQKLTILFPSAKIIY
jgi:multiple sugar transport system substrate-binding protein